MDNSNNSQEVAMARDDLIETLNQLFEDYDNATNSERRDTLHAAIWDTARELATA